MLIFSNPYLVIGILLILALHIVSAILSGKIVLIINIVNIALHIALFLLLIIFGIPFDESALVLMMSVFVYALSHFAVAKTSGEEVGSDDV